MVMLDIPAHFVIAGIFFFSALVLYFVFRMKKLRSEKSVVIKEYAKLNELYAQAIKLLSVMQQTNNYVMISDREDKIIWVNDRFTSITGYTFAEAKGKFAKDILN